MQTERLIVLACAVLLYTPPAVHAWYCRSADTLSRRLVVFCCVLLLILRCQCWHCDPVTHVLCTYCQAPLDVLAAPLSLHEHQPSLPRIHSVNITGSVSEAPAISQVSIACESDVAGEQSQPPLVLDDSLNTPNSSFSLQGNNVASWHHIYIRCCWSLLSSFAIVTLQLSCLVLQSTHALAMLRHRSHVAWCIFISQAFQMKPFNCTAQGLCRSCLHTCLPVTWKPAGGLQQRQCHQADYCQLRASQCPDVQQRVGHTVH